MQAPSFPQGQQKEKYIYFSGFRLSLGRDPATFLVSEAASPAKSNARGVEAAGARATKAASAVAREGRGWAASSTGSRLNSFRKTAAAVRDLG